MDNLIINADDFGKNKEVTEGILEAFKRNYITRTTLMVNMPYSDIAVKEAKSIGFENKIGLHLNLTEGQPLTEEIRKFPAICNEKGLFNGNIGNIVRRRLLSKEEKNAIKNEVKVQIQKFRDYNLPLNHIDSHHHIHTEFQIFNLILPLSSSFESMRISRNLMPITLKEIPKIIYKLLLNTKIKKEFKHTDFFGSYEDFKKYYKSGNVEIMIHPTLKKDNFVYDRISKNQFVNISQYHYQ